MAPALTYGWGVVTARIRNTAWTTSLFPRDGRCALPLRNDVRKAEQLDEGDRVRVELTTSEPQ
jgi:hypothetical protein